MKNIQRLTQDEMKKILKPDWEEYMIGTLYVIAAPSGAGKTTLVKALAHSIEDIKVSISYTTRPARSNEIEGINYFFVDRSTFESMIQSDRFLEYAEIYGHLYGTAVDWVQNNLASGIDVILEIDWQGAQQVRQKFPSCRSIFILPPSFEILKKRLLSRNQDKKEVIARRLAAATEEMSHYREFDYLVVNDVFDEALVNLQSIIRAHRLRQEAQASRLSELLLNLLKNQ